MPIKIEREYTQKVIEVRHDCDDYFTIGKSYDGGAIIWPSQFPKKNPNASMYKCRFCEEHLPFDLKSVHGLIP